MSTWLQRISFSMIRAEASVAKANRLRSVVEHAVGNPQRA